MQAEQTVELCRAACGLDLWSLIESAQYARIVLHEPAANRQEARAIANFMEALSEVIEIWSEITSSNAAPQLRELDARLSDLAKGGLFVHGGCIERSVKIERATSARMPLAVIRIGHAAGKRVAVDIPTELDIALPENEGPGKT